MERKEESTSPERRRVIRKQKKSWWRGIGHQLHASCWSKNVRKGQKKAWHWKGDRLLHVAMERSCTSERKSLVAGEELAGSKEAVYQGRRRAGPPAGTRDPAQHEPRSGPKKAGLGPVLSGLLTIKKCVCVCFFFNFFNVIICFITKKYVWY